MVSLKKGVPEPVVDPMTMIFSHGGCRAGVESVDPNSWVQVLPQPLHRGSLDELISLRLPCFICKLDIKYVRPDRAVVNIKCQVCNKHAVSVGLTLT